MAFSVKVSFKEAGGVDMLLEGGVPGSCCLKVDTSKVSTVHSKHTILCNFTQSTWSLVGFKVRCEGCK